MICLESVGHVIHATAGKIVGIATYKGEYCLVACEYGLYRVWDDGLELVSVSDSPTTVSGNADGQ